MNHQLGMGIIKRIMLVGKEREKKNIRKTRNNESEKGFVYQGLRKHLRHFNRNSIEIKVETHGKFHSIKRIIQDFKL
jgi:hypothetical protein